MKIQVSAEEMEILRYARSLTDKSKKAFAMVLHNYVFMIRNSAAFRKKCDDQRKAGINPFKIWTKKQGFEPVIRADRMA